MTEKKRTGLDALDLAAHARMSGLKLEAEPPTITTAIHIPAEVHRLVRAAAFARANKRGGRPSASAIYAELVEKHREELEREAGPFLTP